MNTTVKVACLALSLALAGCSSTPVATETVTVERQAPASASDSQPPPAPPAAYSKSFSGSGIKTLAPFTLAEDSTLRWTSTGQLFSIYDGLSDPSSAEAPGVPVNSQASSGDTFLMAGKHSFEINADAEWTIRITPGS